MDGQHSAVRGGLARVRRCTAARTGPGLHRRWTRCPGCVAALHAPISRAAVPPQPHQRHLGVGVHGLDADALLLAVGHVVLRAQRRAQRPSPQPARMHSSPRTAAPLQPPATRPCARCQAGATAAAGGSTWPPTESVTAQHACAATAAGDGGVARLLAPRPYLCELNGLTAADEHHTRIAHVTGQQLGGGGMRKGRA